MDINATLLVQMLTFALFVWFTMKFVWPPVSGALDERKNKIADGLAAAEKGHKALELAQHRVAESLREAKNNASDIIDKANSRASKIIDDAKNKAKEEAARQAKIAKEQLEQEVNQVKETLRKQLATLAISGAKKILEREIDEKSNASLLDNLIKEI